MNDRVQRWLSTGINPWWLFYAGVVILTLAFLSGRTEGVLLGPAVCAYACLKLYFRKDGGKS